MHHQNNSLLTALPKTLSADIKTSDQKTLLPTQLALTQLSSQREIRINITVPANALTLEQLLGEDGFGTAYQENKQISDLKDPAIRLLTTNFTHDNAMATASSTDCGLQAR